MSDVPRTVILTEEQDAFVTGVMERRNWNRSQVVRAALDKLRNDPVLFLGESTPDSAARQTNLESASKKGTATAPIPAEATV